MHISLLHYLDQFIGNYETASNALNGTLILSAYYTSWSIYGRNFQVPNYLSKSHPRKLRFRWCGG